MPAQQTAQARPASKRKPPARRQSRLASNARDAQRIAKFARYGKKLFTSEVNYLTPGQIVQILKLCGVDVPHGVQVTAEVAQIIAAGGALISAAQTADSINQVANPSAATIKATAQLMQTIGITKGMEKEIVMIQIGADIAMIIGSAGTNVQAWISLALDLYKFSNYLGFARIEQAAKGQAMGEVYGWYNERMTTQYRFVGEDFKNYSEGKLGTFDFIDTVAQRSPDLLLKFFPQLINQVPEYVESRSFTGEASNYTLGIEQEAEYTFTLQYFTTHYNRPEIQKAIFEGFVKPTLRTYESFLRGYPNDLSYRDLALLCMLPPYIQVMNPDTDFSDFMDLLNLTPNDLGSNIIPDGIRTGKMFTPEKALAPAISYNGVEYFSPSQNQTIRRMSVSKQTAFEIFKADQTGDAFKLFSHDQAYDYVNKWARKPYTGDETQAREAYQSYNSERGVALSAGHKRWDLQQVVKEKSLWRYPNQFFLALRALDDMKKSKIFESWQYSPDEFYSWFGLIDDYEKRHRELNFLVTARAANMQARSTIAHYLGTTIENIEPAEPIQQGKPTVWRKII